MSLPPTLPANSPQRRGGRAVLILFAALVVLVASALGLLAYRYAQPRTYMAQVVIENAPSGDERPRDEFGTQAQLLRKPELLDRVVKMLELTNVYARSGAPVTAEEARERLLGALRFDTSTEAPRRMQIRAYDADPTMAANIANALAVVYRNFEIELLQQNLERALSQYEDEVQKQRSMVQQATVELQRVRERDRVTDPDPEENGTAVSGPETGAYADAKARYLQAKRILANAELALSKARMEQNIDQEPIRIVEKATPPARPFPWWRGVGRI
jgi:flagellar basal body-associated protein FliL